MNLPMAEIWQDISKSYQKFTEYSNTFGYVLKRVNGSIYYEDPQGGMQLVYEGSDAAMADLIVNLINLFPALYILIEVQRRDLQHLSLEYNKLKEEEMKQPKKGKLII